MLSLLMFPLLCSSCGLAEELAGNGEATAAKPATSSCGSVCENYPFA
jgi:hypothetical protein